MQAVSLRLIAPATFLVLAASGCRTREEEGGGVAVASRRTQRHVIVMIPGYASGKLMMTGAGEHLSEALGAETAICSFSDLGLMKPIPEYARELRDFVKALKLAEDDRLDFVAFSMGGLVCRWYVEQMNGRADSIVTLCTPHFGTTKGSFYAGTSSSVRDMQPGSKFLAKLNAGKLPPETGYHSVRIRGDRTLRPRFSAIVPGAKNYLLPGKLHSMAIFRKQVRHHLALILSGKAKPNGPQRHTEEQKEALAPNRAGAQ
jgi:triacylglycerol lipase